MTVPAPAIVTTSGERRILGVDAARALALVGMFATHILPLSTPGGISTVTGLVADGRASALFAVLAGVGVALSTGGVRRPPDGRAHLAAAAGLVVRGALVALIGLWLVRFDPPVAVILAYYGVLFVAAAALLRLPARALAAGAVLACVLAPVSSQVLRADLPTGPGEQPGLADLADPGSLLTTLALTGYYPALPWLAYLLAGMAAGRLDLRSPRVAAWLLGGGAGLAVLARAASVLLLGPGGGAAAIGAAALERRRYGTTPTDTWWWLAVDTPHTGAPLDLAHTTGTALAVLGAMLLLARWAPALVWLPAAVGAIPLTLYTIHVVTVSLVPDDDALPAHLLAAAVIGSLLRLAGRRGPLEAAVSAAGRGTRRLVARAPARPQPAP